MVVEPVDMASMPPTTGTTTECEASMSYMPRRVSPARRRRHPSHSLLVASILASVVTSCTGHAHRTATSTGTAPVGCSMATLRASLTTDKPAYAPGEDVLIGITLTNTTRSPCRPWFISCNVPSAWTEVVVSHGPEQLAAIGAGHGVCPVPFVPPVLVPSLPRWVWPAGDWLQNQCVPLRWPPAVNCAGGDRVGAGKYRVAVIPDPELARTAQNPIASVTFRILG